MEQCESYYRYHDCAIAQIVVTCLPPNVVTLFDFSDVNLHGEDILSLIGKVCLEWSQSQLHVFI